MDLHQSEPVLRRLGLTATANAVRSGHATEAEGWQHIRQTLARRTCDEHPGRWPLSEEWCDRARTELAAAGEDA